MRLIVRKRSLQRSTCGVVLTAVLIIGVSSAGVAGAQPKSTGAPTMKVYKDPVTGKFGVPPAGGTPAPQDPSMSQSRSKVSSDNPPAVLEEKPAPGGGMELDLKGRFEPSLVGSKKTDGKISISHSPDSKSPGQYEK